VTQRHAFKASTKLLRSPQGRKFVVGLLGAWLAWQTTSKTLMAHLAAVSPATAVRLGSSDPTALLNLAEALLPSETEPNADANDQARELATQALLNDPLNARAFRILGETAIRDADKGAASKLMTAAVGRSLRERSAVFWLLQQSLAREDYGAALRCMDVILRTRPQAGGALLPAMARVAGQKNGNSELKKLLAQNPPWRSGFMTSFFSNVADPRTPLDLLLSLKDTPFPPSTEEISAYVNSLIRKNLHELAYSVHLQFLPTEQLSKLGLLYNGNFTTAPSGLPYDWTIRQGSGVTVDLVARPVPDRQRKQERQERQERAGALFVEFGHGRVEFHPVTQLVMLSPGIYRLSGEYMGELRGVRGLVWRMACAAKPDSPIAQTPMFMGSEPSWKTFELEFTVPAEACRAQYVSLALDARSPSETLVSGDAWYTNMMIERVPQTQSPQ
jgi:hypothetical protein